jgi:hypothetical protein
MLLKMRRFAGRVEIKSAQRIFGEGEFPDRVSTHEMFLDDAFQNRRRATVMTGVLFVRKCVSCLFTAAYQNKTLLFHLSDFVCPPDEYYFFP